MQDPYTTYCIHRTTYFIPTMSSLEEKIRQKMAEIQMLEEEESIEQEARKRLDAETAQKERESAKRASELWRQEHFKIYCKELQESWEFVQATVKEALEKNDTSLWKNLKYMFPCRYSTLYSKYMALRFLGRSIHEYMETVNCIRKGIRPFSDLEKDRAAVEETILAIRESNAIPSEWERVWKQVC
jgi:hypothetical protein